VSAKTRQRLVGAVLLALLFAGLVGVLRGPAAQRESPRRSEAARPRAARVTYVYDGDTVEVEGIGKVRLIGIDAMDAHDPDRTYEQRERYGMMTARVKYWAERATNFARTRLQGKVVTLSGGPEPTDRYGRVLAYVQVPDGEEAGEDLNLLMLREGLAAAYRAADHPRRAGYLKAEAEARGARRGMWQDARGEP
jgi:micrococcal nuclease